MSTVNRFLGGGRGDGSPGTWAFIQPWGIAIQTLNGATLLAADTDGHSIRQLEPGGLVRRMAGCFLAGTDGDGGPALLARLRHPYGVATDSSGNIYLSEQGPGPGRIRQVDIGTNIIHTIVPNSPYSSQFGPIQLAYHNGYLYAADQINRRILRYAVPTSGTATTELVAGTGAMGNAGDGGPAISATFTSPMAVTVHANGNVYIADAAGNRVRVIDAAGNISLVADALHQPQAVAVAPNGDVYVAEATTNIITRLGSPKVTVLGTGQRQSASDPIYSDDPLQQPITGPTGLAISHDGTILYAASQPDAMVFSILL